MNNFLVMAVHTLLSVGGTTSSVQDTRNVCFSFAWAFPFFIFFAHNRHRSKTNFADNGTDALSSAVIRRPKTIVKTYPNPAHVATPSFMI